LFDIHKNIKTFILPNPIEGLHSKVTASIRSITKPEMASQNEESSVVNLFDARLINPAIFGICVALQSQSWLRNALHIEEQMEEMVTKYCLEPFKRHWLIPIRDRIKIQHT